MTATHHAQKSGHVTYEQDGPIYKFKEHGRIVLEMACDDCGHPWWVAKSIENGVDKTLVAYTERLNTRANFACLVLESWEPKLREWAEAQQNPLAGYAPASGIGVAQQLRAAINADGPGYSEGAGGTE